MVVEAKNGFCHNSLVEFDRKSDFDSILNVIYFITFIYVGVNTRISYYADWVKNNAIGTSGSSSGLYHQGGFSTLLLLLIIGSALTGLI